MRATTAFNTLLDLPGANVTSVDLKGSEVRLGVRLRRRRLVCPEPDCEYSTRWRADTRPEDSWWRSPDADSRRVTVTARLRRLDCPDHGVRVEDVPFAWPRARFTRDFEDLVAWCASKMDKTAVTRLLRIAWPTVGTIIDRVTVDGRGKPGGLGAAAAQRSRSGPRGSRPPANSTENDNDVERYPTAGPKRCRSCCNVSSFSDVIALYAGPAR